MVRLFRVFIPASVLGLLISEAVLIFSCYVVASFLLLETDPQIFLLYDAGLWRILLVVACIMLALYFNDLYWQFRIRSRLLLVQQMCFVVGIAFLTQALLTYVHRPEWTIPKWIMIYGSGLALVTLPMWRILYGSLIMHHALGAQRILFLGTSAVVRDVAAEILERPEFGLATIGYVDDLAEPGVELPGGPVLGGMADLKSVVESTRPDRIVVGLNERRGRLPVHELLDLRFSGISMEEAQRTYETVFGRVCVREVRPSQLIFTPELGPRRTGLFVQRFYSTVIGALISILLLPFFPVIALIIKLTSSGPVLYRQRRVGLDGKVFTLYKFRSMFQDAEARTGAVWASRDDPRVTSVGRILRKLRIDELPQFFNVLRGEMALVGPRPERPEFVQTLSEQIPYYRQRHSVRPGITGWAQINHKYGDTFEDTILKLEYDLYYIKNLAPTLDLYIMLHTFKVMLLSRGAQ
jgi:sugar transferase (PEP-CTERM system associated)